MADLLEKLMAGVANWREVQWPGSETAVCIRPVTEQDRLEATVAADRFFRDAKSQIGMENIRAYEDEYAVQILFRVVADPVTKKRLCEDIATFRKLLVGNTPRILTDHLNALASECSPAPDSMSSDEFDLLIERVKKNAGEALGNVSDIFVLRKLCSFLAARPSS